MATATEVGATTFTTPSDREIVMTRVVDAPRRLVFEAWTKRGVALRLAPFRSREARDAALQTGMKEGMSQGFDRLDECLRTMA